MNQAITPYHHGDLRNCAIIAAAELIEAMGSYDITIAQVAKRTGVSAPALYRHFKDKDALLTAVRELAHIGIMEYTTSAQDKVEHGTLEHLDALGAAYLRFAMDKKAFFGLMWEDHGQMQPERQNLAHKSTGFSLLLTSVETHLVTGRPKSLTAADRKTALTVATQLWALAHGVATLESNQLLDLFDESAQAEEILAEAASALLAGIGTTRKT